MTYILSPNTQMLVLVLVLRYDPKGPVDIDFYLNRVRRPSLIVANSTLLTRVS